MALHAGVKQWEVWVDAVAAVGVYGLRMRRAGDWVRWQVEVGAVQAEGLCFVIVETLGVTVRRGQVVVAGVLEEEAEGRESTSWCALHIAAIPVG